MPESEVKDLKDAEDIIEFPVSMYLNKTREVEEDEESEFEELCEQDRVEEVVPEMEKSPTVEELKTENKIEAEYVSYSVEEKKLWAYSVVGQNEKGNVGLRITIIQKE